MDASQKNNLCFAPLLFKTSEKVDAIAGGHAAVAKPSLLWDSGSNLTYCFREGDWIGAPDMQRIVVEAFTEWEKYTNLMFELVPQQNADIRVSFELSSGNWSAVGTSAKTQPAANATMNLESVKGLWFAEPYEFSVALHEIGHALGLYHEHQSPSRVGHVTLKEDAVLAYFQEYERWTEDQIRTNILNIYNKTDISNFSNFDPLSIMLYSIPASLTVEGIDLVRNLTLSELDKAFMVINYPRQAPHPSVPEWTFEHALDVAGVDQKTQERLKMFLASNDITKLRVTFNEWSAIQQSTATSGLEGCRE